MPLPAPSSAPTLTLEAGRIIAGKYLLERPAGFGGMAELWVATNQATAAEVCVKVLLLRREADSADEAVARFRREAYAAARLSHRAIVRVFDLLELDATGALLKPARGNSPHAYAIVMELLRGETLGDLLMKRGKLPLEEALDLFLPVLSALAHAHRASVIHRDIKPDNIFLAADPDGHIAPKILDFGVSRLSDKDAITSDGMVLGTPSFMSPEQARGARAVDCRSDVFSAAVLFYLMLSGTNPFEKESFEEAIEALLLSEPPPLTDLPPAIGSVLERAFMKDPGSRFGDATEFGSALRQAAGRKSNTQDSSPLSLRASAPSFPAAYEVERNEPTDRVAEKDLPFEAAEPAPARAQTRSAPPRPGDSIAPAGVPRPNPRVRLLVGAVLGVASLILLVAVIMVVVSPSAPPPAAKRTTAPSATLTATVTATATPTPTTTTTTTTTATLAVTATATVTATPTAAITSTSTSTGPTGTGTGMKAGPTPKASGRKPGEEPNNARDPGF